jgi:hypothetical protein
MTTATATPIHGAKAYAERPATLSVRKISSGAYATLERASEAKIGNAIRLGRRVWERRSLRNGRPRTSLFSTVGNFDTGRA